ncbi:hypothetical protein EJ065_5609 [Corallococcus coralloides]|uniref:Uncharacterized protein n=1 Tax=Corallococcus coralloides TaxID=184914 RepID=A0A410RZ51_CORCK|nr:hypothetical protein EJ065_5609 [Corallococcus coralloides]
MRASPHSLDSKRQVPGLQDPGRVYSLTWQALRFVLLTPLQA